MTARFEISDTSLDGVKLLRRKALRDERGFLERLYCSSELKGIVADRTIKQVNRTLTAKRGSVRGMHFQLPPHAETKFITCLRGEVFDVVVDVRRGSPTFLRWHAEVLSEREPHTLFVPEGFAHGFQTLADDCELLYFHTAYYEPSAEAAINARDPRVGIEWPESITELSSRDAQHPMLEPDFQGITL